MRRFNHPWEDITPSECRAVIAHWVSVLGLAFHPDTMACDYTDGCLTDDQREQYGLSMMAAWHTGEDLYAIGIEEWEKAGLVGEVAK